MNKIKCALHCDNEYVFSDDLNFHKIEQEFKDKEKNFVICDIFFNRQELLNFDYFYASPDDRFVLDLDFETIYYVDTNIKCDGCGRFEVTRLENDYIIVDSKIVFKKNILLFSPKSDFILVKNHIYEELFKPYGMKSMKVKDNKKGIIYSDIVAVIIEELDFIVDVKNDNYQELMKPFLTQEKYYNYPYLRQFTKENIFKFKENLACKTCKVVSLRHDFLRGGVMPPLSGDTNLPLFRIRGNSSFRANMVSEVFMTKDFYKKVIDLRLKEFLEIYPVVNR